MTPFAALVLLGITSPGACAEVGARVTRLRQVPATELRQQLKALEEELGGKLPGAGDEEKRQAGVLRLEALCALWGSAGEEKAPDRKRLEEIYQRPEFRSARQADPQLIQRVFAAVLAWLSSLLGTRGAQSFSEVSRFAVLGLAAVLVAAGALRLIRGRRRSRRVAAPVASGAVPMALEDPAVHLTRAKKALESDGREAIRQGLLALISTLERQRLARPDRVKTNRELADELPERGAPRELTRQVEELIGWYDRTFYSLQDVLPAEARFFVEQIEGLRRGLDQGAA